MPTQSHPGNARLASDPLASVRFSKCITSSAGKSHPAGSKSQIPNVQEKRTQEESVRVAVVDDEEDMRWLLKGILDQADGFTCVGSFSNGNEAVADIPQISPDVVLMDIGMPGLNGIECAKQLKHVLPNVKIIMVTGLRGIDVITEALRAGADAYLLKPVTVEQCVATVNFAVARRETADVYLTTREHQVMQCLAEGLLYKEIADKLRISYSAVHKHQHKIFLKVHATNRSEAIRKWREHGGA